MTHYKRVIAHISCKISFRDTHYYSYIGIDHTSFIELEQSADHLRNMRVQTTDGDTTGEDIGIRIQYSGTAPLLSPSPRIMILRLFVVPAIVTQY
jgi:hypothetical protein